MKSRWKMPGCSVIVLALALAVLPAVSSAQDDLAAEATVVAGKVDRVLLYSDRALVVRVGSATVSEGRSYVAFEGLPEKLLDSSVAAALLGDSAKTAEIANIQVEPVFKTTFRDEEAKEASENLKRLKEEMRRLVNQLESIRSARRFSESIKIGTRPRGVDDKEQYLPLEPQKWAEMLDYFDKEFQSAAERELKLVEEAEDLQAQIVVASAKAQMLLSYKTRKTYRAILEIQALQAGQCNLALSYMVMDAAWFPRYDVRADLQANTVEIISYGLVRQESGEDWSQAAIAFSAAEPSVAADLPKLTSWRITAARPATDFSTAANVVSFDGNVVWTGGKAGITGNQAIILKAGEVRRRREQQAERQAAEIREQLDDFQVEALRYGNYPADSGSQFGSSSSRRLEEQLNKLRGYVQEQEQAIARKDWTALDMANNNFEIYYGNMAASVQDQFKGAALSNKWNRKFVDRQLASMKLADGLVPPLQSSGGYDYRWQALRREDVPSDGALTKVVLLRHEFPAEFVYEIAAAKSKLAFLKTTLKNGTKSPFLTGPVSVFLGNDFVGQSRLETCAPNEELSLGLGADEEIFVERAMETKRDTRGTFTTHYRFNIDAKVTVQNNKRRPVAVAVYERLPYTWDNKLDISSGQFNPKPTRVDPVGGDKERPALLCWEMDLAPGEKKDIEVGYWFQHKADRIAVMEEDPSRKW